MFYGHEYEFNTQNELKDAMEKYIYYYNNRIQLKLKGRTPSEVRNSALNMYKFYLFNLWGALQNGALFQKDAEMYLCERRRK